jgi:hypothetical protein
VLVWWQEGIPSLFNSRLVLYALFFFFFSQVQLSLATVVRLLQCSTAPLLYQLFVRKVQFSLHTKLVVVCG